MNGGGSASYLAPCVPLFRTLFHTAGSRRALDYQGTAGIISIVRWILRLATFGVESFRASRRVVPLGSWLSANFPNLESAANSQRQMASNSIWDTWEVGRNHESTSEFRFGQSGPQKNNPMVTCIVHMVLVIADRETTVKKMFLEAIWEVFGGEGLPALPACMVGRKGRWGKFQSHCALVATTGLKFV